MTDICNRIKVIIVGKQGIQGPPGPNFPGGAAGQVLGKLSNADYDYGWINQYTPSSGLTLPELLRIVSLRVNPIIAGGGISIPQQLCIQGLRA